MMLSVAASIKRCFVPCAIFHLGCVKISILFWHSDEIREANMLLDNFLLLKTDKEKSKIFRYFDVILRLRQEICIYALNNKNIGEQHQFLSHLTVDMLLEGTHCHFGYDDVIKQ